MKLLFAVSVTLSIYLVHDLQPFGVKLFNMSHTINTLSFGKEYPGIINPLNGHSAIDSSSQQGLLNKNVSRCEVL